MSVRRPPRGFHCRVVRTLGGRGLIFQFAMFRWYLEIAFGNRMANGWTP